MYAKSGTKAPHCQGTEATHDDIHREAAEVEMEESHQGDEVAHMKRLCRRVEACVDCWLVYSSMAELDEEVFPGPAPLGVQRNVPWTVGSYPDVASSRLRVSSSSTTLTSVLNVCREHRANRAVGARLNIERAAGRMRRKDIRVRGE